MNQTPEFPCGRSIREPGGRSGHPNSGPNEATMDSGGRSKPCVKVEAICFTNRSVGGVYVLLKHLYIMRNHSLNRNSSPNFLFHSLSSSRFLEWSTKSSIVGLRDSYPWKLAGDLELQENALEG